jgi:hypothetical protein
MLNSLEKALVITLNQAKEQLFQSQRKNGSFSSYAASPSLPFLEARETNGTFLTALIAECVQELPAYTALRRQAARYLARQVSATGTSNYWERNSPDAKAKPYPDDLDDTACALAVIKQNLPEFLSGKRLAHSIASITSAEKRPGGPYLTWVPSKSLGKEWQDIDIVVNSNLAYFLSKYAVKLPNITQLQENAIREKKYTSPYYWKEMPVLYFLVRSYKGKKAHDISRYIKSYPELFDNSLFCAMALTSLLRLQVPFEDVRHLAEYLLANNRKGLWEAVPLACEKRGAEAQFAGSQALTTAFCVEGLCLYHKAVLDKAKKDQRERIMIATFRLIEVRSTPLGQSLKRTVTQGVRALRQKDSESEVVLSTLRFVESLDANTRIPEEVTIQLSAATLYGWIAYTAADDFFDQEGDVHTLPLIQYATRELSKLFFTAVPHERFKKTVTRLMNRVDTANAWEVTCARIPFVQEKVTASRANFPFWNNGLRGAEKSIGHMLGPLGILFRLGYTEDDAIFRDTERYFRYYLTARQLHDDAHDWQEDLKAGIYTPVTTYLLRQYFKTHDDFTTSSPENWEEIKHLYWKSVLPFMSRRIQALLKRAQRILKQNSHFKMPEGLLMDCDRLYQGAKRAEEDHRTVMGFVEEYKL